MGEFGFCVGGFCVGGLGFCADGFYVRVWDGFVGGVHVCVGLGLWWVSCVLMTGWVVIIGLVFVVWVLSWVVCFVWVLAVGLVGLFLVLFLGSGFVVIGLAGGVGGFWLDWLFGVWVGWFLLVCLFVGFVVLVCFVGFCCGFTWVFVLGGGLLRCFGWFLMLL